MRQWKKPLSKSLLKVPSAQRGTSAGLQHEEPSFTDPTALGRHGPPRPAGRGKHRCPGRGPAAGAGPSSAPSRAAALLAPYLPPRRRCGGRRGEAKLSPPQRRCDLGGALTGPGLCREEEEKGRARERTAASPAVGPRPGAATPGSPSSPPCCHRPVPSPSPPPLPIDSDAPPLSQLPLALVPRAVPIASLPLAGLEGGLQCQPGGARLGA